MITSRSPKVRIGCLYCKLPRFVLSAYRQRLLANLRTITAGTTRIHRLLHIGTTSTQLYLEALKAAIAEAKKGKDVRLYDTVVSALYEIVPYDSQATLDSVWADRRAREVKAETDRLEQELKGYKNNLIKESIRVGHALSFCVEGLRID